MARPESSREVRAREGDRAHLGRRGRGLAKDGVAEAHDGVLALLDVSGHQDGVVCFAQALLQPLLLRQPLQRLGRLRHHLSCHCSSL